MADDKALAEKIARALAVLYEDGKAWEEISYYGRGAYMTDAAAVLPIVAEEVRKAKAEAWDQGWMDRSPFNASPALRTDNPYRETGDSDEHR